MQVRVMKLLILGSSGFIGQNLVEHLSALDGFNICAVDKRPAKYITPKNFVLADISNIDLLKKIISEYAPNYIINLAATTNLSKTSEDHYKDNFIIVRNLIEILSNFKEIKLIHFSSMLADPLLLKRYKPNSAVIYYGQSKRAAELLLLENEFIVADRAIILRPTSIWGKYFKEPYVDFFKSIEKGHYFNIGVKRLKSFGYINTVVNQVIQILTNQFIGKIHVVGDKDPYELENFSQKISKAFRVRAPLVINKRFLVLISKILSLILNKNRNPLNSTRLKNLLDPIVYVPKEYPYVEVFEDLDLNKSVETVASWLKKNKI
jgi:GlcNAc-P-P-Und epimerase